MDAGSEEEMFRTTVTIPLGAYLDGKRNAKRRGFANSFSAYVSWLIRKDEPPAAIELAKGQMVPLPSPERPRRIADYYEYIAAGVTTGVAADDGAVKVRLPLTWEEKTDFIVKVYGDSMCGVVEDGDLAAFVRDAEPVVGDIVAAVVDGQTMLKMIAMEGIRKVLRSLNADRKRYPLIPVNSKTIFRGKFVKKYDGPIDRIEDHG